MTDQCKHCQLRGDLKACMAIECSKHEDWYPQQLQQQNDKLTADNAALVEENQALRNELEALKSQHDAMEITYLTTKKPLNKIKAGAVLGIKQNVPMTNNGIEGFYSYSDIVKYANKLGQDNAV